MKFVNFTPRELILLAKILRLILSGNIAVPELNEEEKSQLEPLRARIERKGWV